MNSYTVHYYGLLGERRKFAEESLRSDAASARELYQELDRQHHFGLAIEDLRAAVNDEFVSWDHRLSPNDRVAFLPPMSGG